MKIYKSFKYRIYPTEEQEKILIQNCGNMRYIWNYVLELNKELYKKEKKFLYFNDLWGLIPKLRKELPFLKISYSKSLVRVLWQWDTAIKRVKTLGFPNFRRKNDLEDCIEYPTGCKFYTDKVHIPKLGEIKWVKHRPLQGEPKSGMILRYGNLWYCVVKCGLNTQDKDLSLDVEKIVGCDVTKEGNIILSDGTIYKRPDMSKHLKKLEKEKDSILCKEFSKNRYKQELKIKRLEKRIEDIELDFLHKTSTEISKNYNGVIVEKLNLFEKLLKYKLKIQGKVFFRVKMDEPKLIICSKCNHLQQVLDKKFECKNCGNNIDINVNKSSSIKNRGLSLLGV